MKRLIFLPICLLLVAATCCKQPAEAPVDNYKGLIINEISAHDETMDAVSWVEIVNISTEAISLEGLGLYITDEYFNDRRIYTGSGSLGAGERLVLTTQDESLGTGINSTAQFVLRLGTKEVTTDSFNRDEQAPASLYERGSYQRIPDCSSEWRPLPFPSPGRENIVLDLSNTKSTAIWVWNSHVSEWMEDDFKVMKDLYALGYRHILLNQAAFNASNKRRTVKFIEAAESMGWAVHAWIQCFYNGDWESPVDDENKCYREDIYERIRNKANYCIQEYGVKGLHLDYVRFGGTAYKHNPSFEVTAIGAVDRCCQEIREIVDSYNAGIVASAALMPEINSAQYYGQRPSTMGKYLHILMPMIYRYSYRYSDKDCKDVANWFADNSADALMWSGMQTYVGDDTSVKPMDAEGIRKDIDVFMDSRGTGIVLFRYGLGTFPDVNDIN